MSNERDPKSEYEAYLKELEDLTHKVHHLAVRLMDPNLGVKRPDHLVMVKEIDDATERMHDIVEDELPRYTPDK